MIRLFLSIIVGAILGILGSRFLFVGSWLSLIPWGLTGLIIGFWSENRKEALINGSVYGFVLSFVFMLAGYAGSAPILTRTPFFAILGLFGAFCGLTLGLISNFVKTKYRR